MQNVLLPGAVVLLTVVLWLRRKPVKPMLSSTDASRVAQINRAQLELVIESAADGGISRCFLGFLDVTEHSPRAS